MIIKRTHDRTSAEKVSSTFAKAGAICSISEEKAEMLTFEIGDVEDCAVAESAPGAATGCTLSARADRAGAGQAAGQVGTISQTRSDLETAAKYFIIISLPTFFTILAATKNDGAAAFCALLLATPIALKKAKQSNLISFGIGVFLAPLFGTMSFVALTGTEPTAVPTLEAATPAGTWRCEFGSVILDFDEKLKAFDPSPGRLAGIGPYKFTFNDDGTVTSLHGDGSVSSGGKWKPGELEFRDENDRASKIYWEAGSKIIILDMETVLGATDGYLLPGARCSR